MPSVLPRNTSEWGEPDWASVILYSTEKPYALWGFLPFSVKWLKAELAVEFIMERAPQGHMLCPVLLRQLGNTTETIFIKFAADTKWVEVVRSRQMRHYSERPGQAGPTRIGKFLRRETSQRKSSIPKEANPNSSTGCSIHTGLQTSTLKNWERTEHRDPCEISLTSSPALRASER